LKYSNLTDAYLYLNRMQEARATVQEAQTRKLDSPDLRIDLYIFAFLQGDTEGMQHQVAWAKGKSGVEDVFLANEADTAAFLGRLVKAREFTRRAVTSAVQAQERETAAGYEAVGALREALVHNAAEARKFALAALVLSNGRDVQYAAALAMATAGDTVRALSLADDLAKRFPEDTIVQFNYLPTLRAQVAVNRKDPSNAIETLQTAAPYELGQAGINLAPVYVRGEALLIAHNGSEAATQFQQILGHTGIVWNGLIGALAHLGIARAYALQGDTAKARTAFKEFLTLWKDADPDIPILEEAKAEYAKLQ
jgi:predicted Zn-dependent protease